MGYAVTSHRFNIHVSRVPRLLFPSLFYSTSSRHLLHHTLSPQYIYIHKIKGNDSISIAKDSTYTPAPRHCLVVSSLGSRLRSRSPHPRLPFPQGISQLRVPRCIPSLSGQDMLASTLPLSKKANVWEKRWDANIPALVIACRYRLSCTSPAANTPSTFV